MTEFPTPQLNKFNGVPALTVDVLPTEAELESGAQHAVVWLVGAFARACAQIRETGRSEIAFSDEAFASRISPEIAACLDEQVRWLGRTLVRLTSSSRAEPACSFSRHISHERVTIFDF